MSNILEEYLVKIGAEVDTSEFNRAQYAISDLTSTLRKFSAVLTFGGIASAMAGVTSVIADNIRSIAALDLQYQKLALDMWVTKDTAKSLKATMDVMQVSEEEMAWIPELREQFFRLRGEMNELATPEDADGQLRWIREIGYDVQSLQMKLKMFREWLVYFLIKYLAPHIAQIQKFIQWLNNEFGDRMPELAKKAAFWLSKIVSVMVAAGRAISSVFGCVYRFIEEMPRRTKMLVAAFAAVGVMIMSSPFGLLLASIGLMLVMLEDFFYFLDGKKSSKSLAPLWRGILQLSESDGLFGKLKNILDGIYRALLKITEEIRFDEWSRKFLSAASEMSKALVELADNLATLGERFFKTDKKSDSFFSRLGRWLNTLSQRWISFVNILTHGVKAVNSLLKGNYKEAYGHAKDAAKEFANQSKKEVQAFKEVFIPSGKRRPVDIEEGIEDEGLARLNPRLKASLEMINAEFYEKYKKDLTATSGWRSEEHNADVNGSPTSYHLSGDAVDLDTESLTDDEREYLFEIAKKYGVMEKDTDTYHDRGSGYHGHFTTPDEDWEIPQVKAAEQGRVETTSGREGVWWDSDDEPAEEISGGGKIYDEAHEGRGGKMYGGGFSGGMEDERNGSGGKLSYAQAYGTPSFMPTSYNAPRIEVPVAHGDSTINLGGITVTVNRPNASADEIARAVQNRFDVRARSILSANRKGVATI